MKILIVTGLLLCAVGCQSPKRYVWMCSGKDDAQLRRDSAACEIYRSQVQVQRQALYNQQGQSHSPAGLEGVSKEKVLRADDAFERCMNSKGWQLVRVE
jgi:hypothetical protein